MIDGLVRDLDERAHARDTPADGLMPGGVVDHVADRPVTRPGAAADQPGGLGQPQAGGDHARLAPSAAASSEPDCSAGSQIISHAGSRAMTGARPNVAAK